MLCIFVSHFSRPSSLTRLLQTIFQSVCFCVLSHLMACYGRWLTCRLSWQIQKQPWRQVLINLLLEGFVLMLIDFYQCTIQKYSLIMVIVKIHFWRQSWPISVPQRVTEEAWLVKEKLRVEVENGQVRSQKIMLYPKIVVLRLRQKKMQIGTGGASKIWDENHESCRNLIVIEILKNN